MQSSKNYEHVKNNRAVDKYILMLKYIQIFSIFILCYALLKVLQNKLQTKKCISILFAVEI